MKAIKSSLLVLATVLLLLGSWRLALELPVFDKKIVVDQSLKPISFEELGTFDGTDANKPIYLAYEGNIYDVSEGREYYQKGGVYNFLTGKDSTEELNFAGGSIVKRKYPIVGRLVK